jgi:hypothetical protein
MTIHIARSGNTLYVATENTGAGSDHFLFISPDPPGAPQVAMWSKAGTIAMPTSAIFLAKENDSAFAGWFSFDGAGAATLLQAAGAHTRTDLDAAASGSVLEGTVDLASLFGAVPPTLYLFVAPYASPDGGVLYSSAQMPATTNGDGNIDATEVASWVP